MPDIETNRPTETLPINDLSVHEVKDGKGNLLGHMIVIGSLEIIGSLTPLLLQFGLDPKGIMDTLALAFFTSPVILPILLFIDVCGSHTLITLENHIKSCLESKKEE